MPWWKCLQLITGGTKKMEEIKVAAYSEEGPTPRAGLLCGILCFSGLLFC